MARDILNVDTSFAAAFDPRSLDLHDLEAVRLVLTGASVVDWEKLDLTTREKVDNYLRISLIDVKDPEDRARLHFVFDEAVNYLEEHHDFRFPTELREPEDVRDVFIAASTWTGRFRRRQSLACMILKLMHTINHMEAAELKFRSAISEAELIDRAERRIIQTADRLRQDGYPLYAFYGNRKTRTSVISKLLSKRESTAATIFDKLRFRVVVESQEEVIPVLAHLTRVLFPFNYVIPGESHNNLVDFRRAIKEEAAYQELAPLLQPLRARSDQLGPNPFSSSGYRVVNFIVDFPVRIDDVVAAMDHPAPWMLGRIVYVLVEFQVVDRQTAIRNEEGENAHTLYKERQRRTVERRLLRGSRAAARRDLPR